MKTENKTALPILQERLASLPYEVTQYYTHLYNNHYNAFFNGNCKHFVNTVNKFQFLNHKIVKLCKYNNVCQQSLYPCQSMTGEHAQNGLLWQL